MANMLTVERGVYGTYHHVGGECLPRYVNEDSFRLNEGVVENQLTDRMKGLVKGAANKRLTYAGLTT